MAGIGRDSSVVEKLGEGEIRYDRVVSASERQSVCDSQKFK